MYLIYKQNQVHKASHTSTCCCNRYNFDHFFGDLVWFVFSYIFIFKILTWIILANHYIYLWCYVYICMYVLILIKNYCAELLCHMVFFITSGIDCIQTHSWEIRPSSHKFEVLEVQWSRANNLMCKVALSFHKIPWQA